MTIKCFVARACAVVFGLVFYLGFALLCGGGLTACRRGDRGPAPGKAGGVQDGGRASTLLTLGAEELAAELAASPTGATWLGDHRSDDRLDDVRAESVAREVARLRAMLERVRHLPLPPAPSDAGPGADAGVGPGADRDPAAKLDQRLLIGRIETQLFELVELRPHERNPILYMNLIAFGIDGLLQPDFVPLEGRVRTLAHRLGGVVDLCREAQLNLKNPPEIFTRRAIELGQTTRSFLLLLPRLVRSVTDQKLLEEFNRNNDAARKALDDLLQFLNRDLLPRSRGDWAWPRERLLSRLQTGELLDVSLETVQAAAERDLKDTRAQLEEAARNVAGPVAHPITEAMRLIEEDHPAREELLKEAEATVGRLYQAIDTVALLTLPPGRPRVLEMPPYRWGYALLWSPGPLENRSGESVLYIDPVDPGWTDKKKIADHLRVLNRTQLLVTAMHEVAPGHFVQQEAARGRAPGMSAIRQRARSVALIEGWAHYAEGLLAMRWRGPEREQIRVLVLRQQMLRLARLLAALRLHAAPGGPLPAGVAAAQAQARLDDTVRFLADECGLDDYTARREAERMAYDPLALLPSLGWMQLRRLAAEYEEQEGARFTVKAFHDALLAQGELPVVALRQLLLRGGGTSLPL